MKKRKKYWILHEKKRKILGFTWKKEKNTRFYMKKEQIYWESSEDFATLIFAIIYFVVDGVAKLVFVSVVVKADNSPAPTLWSSLLSPTLLPALVPGNSLSNSCWADGCWFSSISPFAMVSKSLDNFIASFGAFSIFMILFTRVICLLATGCLYRLNELTSLLVCVTCLLSISLVYSEQVRIQTGKSHVMRSRLGTKFLKTITVLMETQTHTNELLILNVRIVY